MEDQRKNRIQMFEDTIQGCERNRRLTEAIRWTREHTQVYASGLRGTHAAVCRVIPVDGNVMNTVGRIGREYADRKLGIWNLCSTLYPGGGVFQGREGIEESLCRCTTLYPCLNTAALWEQFYEPNRTGSGAERCILTPGILCVGRDEVGEGWEREAEWFVVDVISGTADLQDIVQIAGASGITDLVVDRFAYHPAAIQ